MGNTPPADDPNLIELIHQVEDTKLGFRHRVAAFYRDGSCRCGNWAPYKSIARIVVNERLFAAATDFFRGDLPVGKVFEVVTHPTNNTLPLVVDE